MGRVTGPPARLLVKSLPPPPLSASQNCPKCSSSYFFFLGLMPCMLMICSGLKVKNQERFWSMPLPALTRVDLGEVTMEEVTINKHMVVGTAASLPRLTASCPAMESSAHRPALSSASPLAG